jgi:hypothetical protein
MAACTGAVGETIQGHGGSDINVLSESLYCQVLSNCSVIYRPTMHIRNIQVLILMVCLSREISRLGLTLAGHILLANSASKRLLSLAAMGGEIPQNLEMAIRGLCIPRTVKQGSKNHQMSILERFHTRQVGLTFIRAYYANICSQLAVVQFRDDALLDESDPPPLDDVDAGENPIFSLRVSLAILAYSYLKTRTARPSHDHLAHRLEKLYDDVITWKDKVPIEWRPEQDVCAEPWVHQCVLVLHLDYHTLLVTISTTLSVMSHIKPDPATVSPRHTTGKLNNARRILQTFQLIQKSPEFSSWFTCWYSKLSRMQP